MILDTTYLIALASGDADATALAQQHESTGIPQRIPTMAISELYAGIGAGSQPNENARKYEELLGNLPTIGMDANIARRAGALRGVHIADDTKPRLGRGDSTIAATGLVYNEPVVTDDTDDFGSVDGLDVVTW
ncbi:MAG: tRNA(fMet)-specific endonuclease VapC [Haloarculaceae archaeon]|jgi:tRNA(fMet)-specific endonuclease VapC